jgi:hypothetical protein
LNSIDSITDSNIITNLMSPHVYRKVQNICKRSVLKRHDRREGEINWSTARPPGQAPTLGPEKLKFSQGNLKSFWFAEIMLAVRKCPPAEETLTFLYRQYYFRERTNDGMLNINIIYLIRGFPRGNLPYNQIKNVFPSR